MSEDFDQDEYWIGRHRRLRSDPRSVGNLGKSIEQNLAGEEKLKLWVGRCAEFLKPYQTVLDVGCGYGRVASAFCDAGYDYTGIDVSPDGIAAARLAEPRGNFLVGSALTENLGGPYDLVASLYVFVHFVSDESWRLLIGRLSRHLRMGGGLLFADDFPDLPGFPAEHVRTRPLSMYAEVFATCGLELDDAFSENLGNHHDGLRGSPSLAFARKVQ